MSYYASEDEQKKEKSFISKVADLIARAQNNSDHYITDDSENFAKNLIHSVQCSQSFNDFWYGDVVNYLTDLNYTDKNQLLLSLLSDAPHDFKTCFILILPSVTRSEDLKDIDWRPVFHLLVDDDDRLYRDGDHVDWHDISNNMPALAKMQLDVEIAIVKQKEKEELLSYSSFQLSSDMRTYVVSNPERFISRQKPIELPELKILF